MTKTTKKNKAQPALEITNGEATLTLIKHVSFTFVFMCVMVDMRTDTIMIENMNI